MTYFNPQLTHLYHAATKNYKQINDARKLCIGCHQQRSMGQFDGSDYCKKCVLRGVNVPKVTKRNPKQS